MQPSVVAQRIEALIAQANVARWAALEATDDVTIFLANREADAAMDAAEDEAERG